MGKEDNQKEISQLVEIIRGMFQSMDLGEISVSAYDTAWVGLVPSLDDPTSPQFPKSLDWIIKNQFPDGSWGNEDLFLAYDRVCSTLACVVALKTWNIGHDKVQRGKLSMFHNSLNIVNYYVLCKSMTKLPCLILLTHLYSCVHMIN